MGLKFKTGAVALIFILSGFHSIAQEEEAPPEEIEEEAPVVEPSEEPAAEEPVAEEPPPSMDSGGTSAPASAPSMGSDEYESIPAPAMGEDEEADIEVRPPSDSTVAEAQQSTPSEYAIQSGDTLWDICQKFLGNPWYWPKLWSLNQYIENPHLIYPGDKIRFFSGSETAPPQLDIVSAGQASGKPAGELPPGVDATESLPTTGGGIAGAAPTISKDKASIKLRSLTFISERELKTAGRISHSGEPKLNLVFGDRVYLDFNEDAQVAVGNRYHVIEKVKKVRNPDSSFGSLGHLIKKKAVLKVVALHEDTVEALVVDADDSIARGDRFIPYENPIREITLHEASQKLMGKIVEAENQQYLISNNDFVFLNLGRQHGVDDGLKLVVVRRGDGVFQGSDKNLPYVVVANLVVVESRDTTSTAYVTSLRDSLTIGDQVFSRLN